MDTAKLEESMAGMSQTFRKFSLAIVIVTMLITGLLLVNLIYNPPTFNTDLDAFTPDSEASDAQHEPPERQAWKDQPRVGRGAKPQFARYI